MNTINTFDGHQATVREILCAPKVSDCRDDDVVSLMELSPAGGQFNYSGKNARLVTAHNVIDVSYDGERGARASVLFYCKLPFAIVMQSGRGLRDFEDFIILDPGMFDFAVEALKQKVVYGAVGIDDLIDLAYWEGIPVKLGDIGYFGSD